MKGVVYSPDEAGSGGLVSLTCRRGASTHAKEDPGVATAVPECETYLARSDELLDSANSSG